MSMGSTVLVLIGGFVALLLILWALIAGSKPVPSRPQNMDANAAGPVPPAASGTARQSAEEDGAKATTIAAAWWWLNHRSDSEKKSGADNAP